MEFRIPTDDSASASASFTAGAVRVKCSILPGAECQNVSHFRRGNSFRCDPFFTRFNNAASRQKT